MDNPSVHYQVVDQKIPLWLCFLSRPLMKLDQGVWVEVNNPKNVLHFLFLKFRQSMASQTKKESQNLHD